MSEAVKCVRCGRGPSGENLDDLEWEVIDGHDVCPDCVTPSEVQALDEDVMHLADTTPTGEPGDPRATLAPVEDALGKPIDMFTGPDAKWYLFEVIGDDWEEALILADAMAGPGSSDDEVDAAADRACALARERTPDLTDRGAELVRTAWVTLWVDVPLEG